MRAERSATGVVPVGHHTGVAARCVARLLVEDVRCRGSFKQNSGVMSHTHAGHAAPPGGGREPEPSPPGRVGDRGSGTARPGRCVRRGWPAYHAVRRARGRSAAATSDAAVTLPIPTTGSIWRVSAGRPAPLDAARGESELLAARRSKATIDGTFREPLGDGRGRGRGRGDRRHLARAFRVEQMICAYVRSCRYATAARCHRRRSRRSWRACGALACGVLDAVPDRRASRRAVRDAP